jgi:hypothetical protein
MRKLRLFPWMVLVVLCFSMLSCIKPKESPTLPSKEESSAQEVIKDIEKDLVDLDKVIESQDHLLTPEQFASFDIVKSSKDLRQDGGETLFVLVPAVDLELRNHVTQIKNLIKKLVVLEKRPENVSIYVFDEAEALEKVFQNPQTEDLNVPVHFLAKYIGSPEDGVYRNNLVIFPIAPKSNPAVFVRQDTIDFDPFEW